MSGPAAIPPAGNARSERIGAAALFLLLALAPTALDGYPVFILPQYMLFGVMAMSLCVLWGFGGIVSFGQAAFFAMGGYAMGISMNHAGMAPNPAYIGLLLGVLLSAALAAAAAFMLFSAGVRATYFVIVTLAFSIMTEQILVSQSEVTGGWSGMFIERMTLSLGAWAWPLASDTHIYYVVLAVTAGVYALLSLLMDRKFGRALKGIRENEDRMIALGYRTDRYKTGAFALSAGISGLAGGLYATHAGFISPSLAGVLFSTEVVVWVAIGGRQSLLGALTAGIAVSFLSNYLSAITPEYWSLILGILFIVCIMYFQGGVAGAAGRLGRAGR